MDITLDVKVGALLEAYPQLEQTLYEISPMFKKLSNPILRKTVARVTSLKQVAEVGGIPPVDLINRLREAAGFSPFETDEAEMDAEGMPQPAWFDEAFVVKHFDADAVIAKGQNPMDDILKQCDCLQPGEILQLTVSFRPIPIIKLLHSRGYVVWSSGSSNYITRNSSTTD